jgi:hypothetical protein
MSEYTIRRLNTDNNQVFMDVAKDERDARGSVYWCAYYNLGWTKQACRRAADAATIGEPFSVGNYVFTIEERES